MITRVLKAKLLAQRKDLFDYTTYAFLNLDSPEYILCTRFPRWETPEIADGEVGILQFKEVIAGKDTWFDGTTNIPYNYTGWHFINFVPLKEEKDDLIVT